MKRYSTTRSIKFQSRLLLCSVLLGFWKPSWSWTAELHTTQSSNSSQGHGKQQCALTPTTNLQSQCSISWNVEVVIHREIMRSFTLEGLNWPCDIPAVWTCSLNGARLHLHRANEDMQFIYLTNTIMYFLISPEDLINLSNTTNTLVVLSYMCSHSWPEADWQRHCNQC